MNPRKEATYRMLSLIAAVIFVLPCVFLVFPIFDINPDDLWQMDSLMEFICAYKNTAILAIVGVLIQIVIALPAGYAIARIPSPKAQTFFLLTCVFFFAFAAASTYAPSISGSDEYWMVGFSERAIDNDGFPALDDFTLLVRSKKN